MTPPSIARTYRPDLDGMRAVAVLLVMLYHYGVPPVTGGYLGVDVFFVLSGYFITQLILRGHEEKSFSYLGFYERRARRLMPVALTVLTVTSLVMVQIVPPGELVEFFKSVFASLFFVANFHFKDTFTYFGPAAETQPLLHYWSLSVEEQFYFIAPTLLIFLLRWSRQMAFAGLALLGLASLVLSGWQAHAQPPDAFFHLPSRGWELIAGCLLAVRPLPMAWLNGSLQGLLRIIALGIITMQAFMLTRSTPFPGLNALPCVIATMAIITTGADMNKSRVDSFSYRLLSNPVMNWTGKISYSLYLWHWPVLVLYRLQYGEPYLYMKAVLLVVTFCLATGGYYIIEQPIRQQRFLRHRASMTLALSGISVLLISAGTVVFASRGFAARSPASVLEVEADLRREADQLCRVRQIFPDGLRACALGTDLAESIDPQNVRTLLIGDSHARALQPYFADEAKRHHMSMLVLYKGDCLPLVSADFHKEHRLKCPQMKSVIRALPDQYPALTHVFIAARWQRVTEPRRNGQAERIGLSVPGGRVIRDVAGRREILATSLGDTVAMFVEQGIGVTLIGQVPSYIEPPTRCIIRALWAGTDPEGCGLERDKALLHLQSSDRILSDIAAQYDNVDVWKPGEAFCRNQTCAVFRNGHSLYRDDNHLSLSGSVYLSRLMPLMNWPD